MKKLLILLFTCNILYSQTYNENYLDGTIIFKLNNFKEIIDENITKTPDNIGANIDIKDYPLINEIFKGINITRFERPSYYSGKRELQKIYRVVFSEFEKIDFLINKLNTKA